MYIQIRNALALKFSWEIAHNIFQRKEDSVLNTVSLNFQVQPYQVLVRVAQVTTPNFFSAVPGTQCQSVGMVIFIKSFNQCRSSGYENYVVHFVSPEPQNKWSNEQTLQHLKPPKSTKTLQITICVSNQKRYYLISNQENAAYSLSK